MNALDLLKSDHDRIDGLIDRFEDATSPEVQREVFERLRDEIELHAHVVETVFYPHFQSKSDDFHEQVRNQL